MSPPATSIAELLPEDAGKALGLLAARRRGGFLNEHLERLAALRAHGNRKLRVDQLFLGLLLSFFEPMGRSLRTIEDQGDFDGRLELPRLARSTTADALAAFDPACLKPILDDLRDRVPHLAHADGGDLDAAGADRQRGRRRVGAGGGVRPRPAVGRAVRDRPQLPGLLVPGRAAGRGRRLRAARAGQRPGRDGAGVAAADGGRRRGGRDRRRDRPPERARGAPDGRFRRVTISTINRKGETEIVRLLSNLIDPQVAARVIGAIYRQR